MRGGGDRTHINRNPGSRAAFLSNVTTCAQPARSARVAISASANDPCFVWKTPSASTTSALRVDPQWLPAQDGFDRPDDLVGRKSIGSLEHPDQFHEHNDADEPRIVDRNGPFQKSGGAAGLILVVRNDITDEHI